MQYSSNQNYKLLATDETRIAPMTPSPKSLPSGTWTIDPNATTVTATAKMMKLIDVGNEIVVSAEASGTVAS